MSNLAASAAGVFVDSAKKHAETLCSMPIDFDGYIVQMSGICDRIRWTETEIGERTAGQKTGESETHLFPTLLCVLHRVEV